VDAPGFQFSSSSFSVLFVMWKSIWTRFPNSGSMKARKIYFMAGFH